MKYGISELLHYMLYTYFCFSYGVGMVAIFTTTLEGPYDKSTGWEKAKLIFYGLIYIAFWPICIISSAIYMLICSKWEDIKDE